MQSKRQSAIEALVNIIVGFVLSVMVQYPLYGAFGWETSLTHNMTITLIFTLISFIRSYLIRRIFNHQRKTFI